MADNNQGLYASVFRHNRDAKGRLTVPSKWRFEGDEQQQYLAIPDPDGCITVFPPRMQATMIERLQSLSLGNKAGKRAVTRLLSGSDTFELDAAGRFKIKDELYEHAGIGKNVALVGVLDRFQLWEPERYNQYLSAEEDEGDAMGETLASIGL